MTKDIPAFVSRTTNGYWIFRDVWQFFDELPSIIDIDANKLPIECEPDTSVPPSFGVHVIRTTEGFFVRNAYTLSCECTPEEWEGITPEEFSRVSGFPSDTLAKLPIETLPGVQFDLQSISTGRGEVLRKQLVVMA